jgi:hypothetical protein
MLIPHTSQIIGEQTHQIHAWWEAISTDLFLDKPEEAVPSEEDDAIVLPPPRYIDHIPLIQKLDKIHFIEREKYFCLKELRHFSSILTNILDDNEALLSLPETDKELYSKRIKNTMRIFLNRVKSYVGNYAQELVVSTKNDIVFTKYIMNAFNELESFHEMEYLCNKIATCLIILDSKINKVLLCNMHENSEIHLQPSTSYRTFLKLEKENSISLWMAEQPELMRDYCKYVKKFKSNIYCIWLNGCGTTDFSINQIIEDPVFSQYLKHSDRAFLYRKLLRGIAQLKKGIYGEMDNLYEHAFHYCSNEKDYDALYNEYNDFSSRKATRPSAPLKLPQLGAMLERFQQDMNQHQHSHNYRDSIDRLIMPLSGYFRPDIPYCMSLFELLHRTTALHIQEELFIGSYSNIISNCNSVLYFLNQFKNII